MPITWHGCIAVPRGKCTLCPDPTAYPARNLGVTTVLSHGLFMTAKASSRLPQASPSPGKIFSLFLTGYYPLHEEACMLTKKKLYDQNKAVVQKQYIFDKH